MWTFDVIVFIALIFIYPYTIRMPSARFPENHEWFHKNLSLFDTSPILVIFFLLFSSFVLIYYTNCRTQCTNDCLDDSSIRLYSMLALALCFCFWAVWEWCMLLIPSYWWFTWDIIFLGLSITRQSLPIASLIFITFYFQ